MLRYDSQCHVSRNVLGSCAMFQENMLNTLDIIEIPKRKSGLEQKMNISKLNQFKNDDSCRK